MSLIRKSDDGSMLLSRHKQSRDADMHKLLPLLLSIAIPAATAQSINRCKIDGKTVYTDLACGASLESSIKRAEPAPPRTISTADSQDQQLARQYDQRMAQRDRDQSDERFALQQQTIATNSECSRLRNQRSSIQRQPASAQQSEYWRSEMRRTADRMNQLHC